MRILISILICASVLLQTMSKSIIAYQFTINQKEIAEKLCENKSMPMKHCNGHCVLKKQMKADDKQQNGSAPVKEKYEVQYFFSHSVSLFFNSTDEKKLFTPVLPSGLLGYPSSVFHPPLA